MSTMIRRAILALAMIVGLAPAFAQAPPAVPALPDAERRTSYTPTASAGPFAVGFAIFGDGIDYANWVEVFLNGIRVNWNDPTFGWVLTSPSGPFNLLPRPVSNAVVTFNSPQTGTVQIVGARRPRRTAQFAENRGVAARDLNQALTDIVAQNREIWDKTNDVTGRALVSAPGTVLGLLPIPSLCAGKFLSFDVTGLIPQCLPGAGSGNVVGPLASAINNIPSFANITGSLLQDTGTLAAPVATIAALKALAPPTTAVNIFVQGYSAPGDGGEGWFYYSTSSNGADDGGTTLIPNSAPATGRWQRLRQSTTGAHINVRWFGAQCGAATATNNAAFASAATVAQAVKGALYFPGCSTGSFYSGNLALVDTSVSLLGDGFNSQIFGALNTTTVDISSNIGCGFTHDFTIRGIYLGASGASGIGLHIKNAGWLSIENTRVDGPAAIKIECASQFNITNVQAYSGGLFGPALWITSGGSNSAPGVVSGGQFTTNGGSSSAIVLTEPLAIEFAGVNYSVANGTQTAAITVDGATGSTFGSVTFKEMHSESDYNLASTAADYEIGKNFKAGSVKIEGGNSWGLGDLSHSQQDFVRIFAARNVEVSNAFASKLGGTGYTRSMIRLESTFPASGDTYTFCGNVADVSGAMYSDANGKLTGQTGCASNINQYFVSAFSLSGTLTPAALSGDVNDYNPTGQSSATVLRIDGGASSRNITGLAGGLDGRLLTVINVGTTNPLIVKNESASSAAANRMTVGLDITVDVNKSLTLRYDGTSARWRPWDSIYSSVSVPISRIISTTSPITGGGDLSIDRTFACATCVTSSGGGAISGTAPVAVSAAGVVSLNAPYTTLTASNGGVVYSGAANLAILAGTATARQMLQSGSSTTPAWSTSTWPATTTINRLLYSSAANVISDLATANGGVLNTTSGGVPSVTPTPVLGVAGTTVGSIGFQNATSGTVTLSPVTGALGSTTVTIPAATDTMALLAAAQAFTNKTYNGNTWTAGTGTLTLGAGKTATVNNSVTLAGTDATTMTFPATSASIARTDAGQTFTGTQVFGAITVTSVNKMAITAPASSSTLAVADGKTLTASNTITLTGTDGITVPFGTATKQVLITGTNLTYTTPPNAKSLRFRMVGGGAGGAPYIVSVAATAGGDTCWNTSGTACTTPVLKAGGGGAASVTTKGTGGAATGCSLNLAGGNGSDGSSISNSFGGNGGVSAFGGNGWGGNVNPGLAAATNSGSGGGGSGSAATAQTGGGGGAGAYCEAIITSPAATYVYTVGAAGAAGTGTVNGGAGAAGLIIVDEYYNLRADIGWHGQPLACNDNTMDFCKAM